MASVLGETLLVEGGGAELEALEVGDVALETTRAEASGQLAVIVLGNVADDLLVADRRDPRGPVLEEIRPMVRHPDVAETVGDLEIAVVHPVLPPREFVLMADVAGVRPRFGAGVALGRHHRLGVVDRVHRMGVGHRGEDVVERPQVVEQFLEDRLARGGGRFVRAEGRVGEEDAQGDRRRLPKVAQEAAGEKGPAHGERKGRRVCGSGGFGGRERGAALVAARPAPGKDGPAWDRPREALGRESLLPPPLRMSRRRGGETGGITGW